MLFIFMMDLIGYTVVGLKFAFALAVFAGIAELVPLVGPYIGGAPAILIALTQGPTLAIVECRSRHLRSVVARGTCAASPGSVRSG